MSKVYFIEIGSWDQCPKIEHPRISYLVTCSVEPEMMSLSPAIKLRHLKLL